MKILVATPTYDGMEYCFNEFLETTRNIDFPEFDILIVDNSRSKKFWRKIRKIPFIKAIHDETMEEKNMLRLISSRNKILDYAIQKNYDYLLMLDSDVMVPSRILKKLLSENKDVISGLYFNKLNLGGPFQTVPIAYNFVTQEEFDELKINGDLPEEASKKEDLRRYLTNEEIDSKKAIEVRLASGGCLLLSKKAFNSGAIYGLEKRFKIETSDDVYLFNRLKEKGFKIYCDTSLICDHRIQGKYSEGKRHYCD